jgi:hypothetical protein
VGTNGVGKNVGNWWVKGGQKVGKYGVGKMVGYWWVKCG